MLKLKYFRKKPSRPYPLCSFFVNSEYSIVKAAFSCAEVPMLLGAVDAQQLAFPFRTLLAKERVEIMPHFHGFTIFIVECGNRKASFRSDFSEHRISSLVREVGIISMREEYESWARIQEVLLKTSKIHMVLDRITCVVFLESQKGKVRLWQSKEPTALYLLPFSHFSLHFSSGRKAKAVFHAHSARTNNSKIDWASAIRQETDRYPYRVEVIWVWS